MRRIITAREQVSREDMSPGLPLSDEPYGFGIDPIASSKHLGRSGTSPYLSNLLSGKLGGRMRFAHCCSAAFISLTHIVSRCTKMQMKRLYTDRSVAGMQNEKPRWYWSVIDSMGSYVGSHFSSRTHAEAAIALAVQIPSPVPATVCGRGSDRRLSTHEPLKSFFFGHAARPHVYHCSAGSR